MRNLSLIAQRIWTAYIHIRWMSYKSHWHNCSLNKSTRYYCEYDHPKHDDFHPDSDNSHRLERNTNHNGTRVVYYRRLPRTHSYRRKHWAQHIWHSCMTFHKLVHKYFLIRLRIDSPNHIHNYLWQRIHHLHMAHYNSECICFAWDDARSHRCNHISRVQYIFHLDIHRRKSEHIRHSPSPNCSSDYLISEKDIKFRFFL